MMTMYVVSSYLQSGQIQLTDSVRISTKAWKSEGSKLFVKQGDLVDVETLIKGVIIVSGNDASIALAEHIAGSEEAFVSLMNSTAAHLGMTQTHFENVTGLPHPDHRATVKDLATLAQALIRDYPNEYAWYQEKTLRYGGIKQSNRNRLLWRDQRVDGIKTGHTQSAGYCLVSSGIEDGLRLIAVVVGEPSDATRTSDTASLLTWGFRFYESHALFPAQQKLSKAKVWFGQQSKLAIGIDHPFVVTVEKGQWQQQKPEFQLNHDLKAPIQLGEKIGKVILKNQQGDIISQQGVIALETIERAGWLARLWDHIALFFYHLVA